MKKRWTRDEQRACKKGTVINLGGELLLKTDTDLWSGQDTWLSDKEVRDMVNEEKDLFFAIQLPDPRLFE